MASEMNHAPLNVAGINLLDSHGYAPPHSGTECGQCGIDWSGYLEKLKQCDEIILELIGALATAKGVSDGSKNFMMNEQIRVLFDGIGSNLEPALSKAQKFLSERESK